MDFSPAELETFPGYYIRRLQQLAVAVFTDEVQDWGVTPVQFAALSAVARMPGLDQRSLARFIAFDASTIGAVIDRLETRGLLSRSNSPKDRRVRLLNLTDDGRQLLIQAQPAVLRAQARMLEPLPEASRGQFMALLTQLIDENDRLARAEGAAAGKEADGEA
jgi:DNA-binding MarR family transcriptional regulator